MAPIFQVACTPITQIYLKRLKHASSIFIDMTDRSRSNCLSQLLSCRTCTRMVQLKGAEPKDTPPWIMLPGTSTTLQVLQTGEGSSG